MQVCVLVFACRKRGLVTLHGVGVCGFLNALLLVYALPIPCLLLSLIEGALWPYYLAVLVAMVASSGAIRKVSGTLRVITAGAFALVFEQIAFVFSAIFNVVFALIDKGMGRVREFRGRV